MQYSAWQLSAEHRPPNSDCDRQPPAQPEPQPCACMWTGQHQQAMPCPLGTLSPGWSLNRPFNKKETLFKNPHPQILHVILGQMNKGKLLLLTFMQNDRKGTLGRSLAPVTAREEWPPGHRSLSLVWPRPEAQAQGPPAWGWGWNVVPGARGL